MPSVHLSSSVFLRIVIRLLIGIPFAVPVLLGQNPVYETRHITSKDGLCSSTVTTIKKDLHGLLWVGTLNGLNTFDGQRVEVFDPKTSITNQLLNPKITDLELGPEGYLFVCTPYGTRVIDPSLRRYISLSDLGIPDSLFQSENQIEKNEAGDLFVLKGATIYLLKRLASGKYRVQPKYALPSCSFTKLLLGKAGDEQLWAITEDCGILRIRASGVQKMHITYANNHPPELYYYNQRHFHVLKDNSLWDHAGSIFRASATSDTLKSSINYIPVDDFPGLTAIDSILKYKKTYLTCFENYDAEQEIYGTSNGLFILRKKNNTAFNGKQILKGQEIRGIYTEPDGRWWVGTYTGLYSGTSQNTQITKSDTRYVWQMFSLDDTTFFVAAEAPRGFWTLDKRSGVQKNLTVVEEFPFNIMHTGALNICRDFQGGLWAGTYTHLLYAPPAQPYTFSLYKDPETGDHFQRNFIRSVFVDRDSSIWVGAYDGLHHIVFDPKHNKFRPDCTPPYIRGVPISHIVQDHYGDLWIATKGKGIAKINRQNGNITWLNTTHGLSNNMTCRIERSHNGRVLWISTHNGLSRYDILNQVFENYYEEDGLIGNEFNSAASNRSHNGQMLFGGVNGLTEFHPDSIRVSNFRYRTFLPFIRVYNTDSDTILSLSTMSEVIKLPPYPEYIEIPLACSEFIQNTKVIYRYRLLGLSEKWNYTNGEQEIKFIHLSPGAYLFEAQALPPNGHFGPVNQIALEIQAPFYERWWFYTCCFLALVLLAYGIHRYRIYQLEKVQLIRRQIADDLHDDIGNKLNIISILAQKIALSSKWNDTETQQSALQKLIAASRETLSSLHTMIWTIDAKKGRLFDLITRMQDFADSYLIPLHIPCTFDIPSDLPGTEMNLQLRHHLMLLYQEIITNMVKHTQPKKIVITIRLLGNQDLELTFTNIFQTNITDTLQFVSSTKRGEESIRHRLSQINGHLLKQENSIEKQKITFYFSQIFK